MKVSTILLPLAAVALVPAAAQAEPAKDQPAAEATANAKLDYIPFANQGGVWDWRSDGDSTVYFKDAHGRWFKAELFSPAHDLPYVEYIGIDARGTGRLDKFGGVYVKGQHYAFKSFEQVDGPPSKKKKD